MLCRQTTAGAASTRPFECGLAHTWSLVVEATFYAVLPLYVIIADRLTRGLERHRWVLAQLGLLGVAAALSMVLQYLVLDPAPRWVTGSAIGYVLWFALGMGMAVVSVSLGAGVGRRGAPPRGRPTRARLARGPHAVWPCSARGFPPPPSC